MTKRFLGEGDCAPDFTLQDSHGNWRSMRSLVVVQPFLCLYFYPKDFTYGCTCQAKRIASLASKLEMEGCHVVGISPDSPEKHLQFTQKYGLPYLLLSDPKRKVAKNWGAVTLFGLLNKRCAFLIDQKGRIVKKYSGIIPSRFADHLLDDLLHKEALNPTFRADRHP